MNRYSRIFHHITTEDVKRKRRENIKVQEIKDELERERLEAIVEPVQHVDWRDDLKELAGFEWGVTSNGPTNSASTKFTGQYNGSATARIKSFFTTPWLSGKNPVVKKRWGRPQVVMDAASTSTMQVDVYSDYDKASTDKTVYLNIAGRDSAYTWETNDAGTGSLWNTATWSSEAAASITDVVRLQSLGLAKSVALKINGPSQSVDWEINGIMFTYKPRRLR